jgi:hypothetical protein
MRVGIETNVIRYRTPAQKEVFLNESIGPCFGTEALGGVVIAMGCFLSVRDREGSTLAI